MSYFLDLSWPLFSGFSLAVQVSDDLKYEINPDLA